VSFPGPREIDPSIRDRLIRSLLIEVHEICVKAGLRPSAKRVKRAVRAGVREFLQWQDADTPRERRETIGWYYEGNGNGRIEKTAFDQIRAEMGKLGISSDPRGSTNQAIVDAAGDEGDDGYAEDPSKG
jgi:hypothetical protein